jgi:gluconate kinase
MPAGLLKSQFETLEEPQDGLRVDVTQAPEIIVETIIESLNLASRPTKLT